ncbi:OsmC family peroxiredoxin [Neobacillus notoginsengisoli]|uniref:OsmC family peroxiredoxin n=1 Tax=Neobacillus notoginsengisoli TaxID=1578198 RepID=A0A417YW04_9BACI|nr:OsmC family protein [Neobacillus notoginsengisoli]RHW41562.1 OsmC family peroxiredoxin [Neobacillus notoginsengisoli]
MIFKMKDDGFFTELPFGRLDVSGNEEVGFRPYQLMAASVAVCSGGVLRKILEKKRLEVRDIEIQTNVDRNENQVNKIETIHIHFVITGNNLNETQIEKAITLVGKNCSMVQSVKGSIDVRETFELKG